MPLNISLLFTWRTPGMEVLPRGVQWHATCYFRATCVQPETRSCNRNYLVSVAESAWRQETLAGRIGWPGQLSRPPLRRRSLDKKKRIPILRAAKLKEVGMRLKSDPQRYFQWSTGSSAKIVREYEEKFKGISDVLDANPQVLELAAADL